MVKRQVILVLTKNEEVPTVNDSKVFKFDIEVPDDFIYAPIDTIRVKTPQKHYPSDSHTETYTILSWKDYSDLQGKMLTLVDAAITDPEQRKALKDITRDSLNRWNGNLRNSALDVANWAEKQD